MYKHRNTEDAVREFHAAMGADLDQKVGEGKDTADRLAFRMKLIREEFEEADEAAAGLAMAVFQKRGEEYTKKRWAHFLKELCDLQYVLDGTFVALGLPKMPAFNRVHKSNMSKLGDDGKPIVREDGKIMKSDNYLPPDLESLWEKM